MRLACSELATLLCYRGTVVDVRNAVQKVLANIYDSNGPVPPIDQTRQKYDDKIKYLERSCLVSERARKRLNGIRREKDILRTLETLLPAAYNMLLCPTTSLLGPKLVLEKHYAVVPKDVEESRFSRYASERRYEMGQKQSLCEGWIRVELIGRADGSILSTEPRIQNYVLEVKKRHHRKEVRRKEETQAARVQAASYAHMTDDSTPPGLVIVEAFEAMDGSEDMLVEIIEPQEGSRIWYDVLMRLNHLTKAVFEYGVLKHFGRSESEEFDAEAYRKSVLGSVRTF